MSFSSNIPATKPDADAIRARLDGLEPSPPIVNPAGQEAFAKAKEAFAALAADVASGDFNVGGSISGHFYQEGYSRQNSITVSVNETTFDTPEDVAAKKAAESVEGVTASPNGAPPEESVDAPAETPTDEGEPSEETLKVEEELAEEGVSSEGIPGQPTDEAPEAEPEPAEAEAVEGDEPAEEPAEEPAPAATGLTSRNP